MRQLKESQPLPHEPALTVAPGVPPPRPFPDKLPGCSCPPRRGINPDRTYDDQARALGLKTAVEIEKSQGGHRNPVRVTEGPCEHNRFKCNK